ncbi:DNA adenine methylase [Bartonella sp. HY761]|uniref:DNA adenine methylase n=1 Tax=Bartonella sp. HY761 TaxID=2979330 RepID=UPI0021E28F27|nr:Dam family site-specific DNA-(adenine-N6)-methyltransferase [Bartonella sp. HY761]UXN08163.1 Dam family site-specific DNA-(adenine-N6)-methyltransferase [Bartonella sp. HY761]
MIKSPLNYIGGKYKLLPQILPLFPKKIGTFFDVFAGGCNVGMNITSQNLILNDNLTYLIDLYRFLQKNTEKDILFYIENRILSLSLSQVNEVGYLELRRQYNDNRHPLDLFILSAYSFNHQIRFNNSHKFNTPFGKKRSCFNDTMKINLINFIKGIQRNNIKLLNLSFDQFNYNQLCQDDLVYCDPPYLITTGTYNDGKRGFSGWNEIQEVKLLCLLSNLGKKGIRFALSNVIEHKGKSNDILKKWLFSEGYNMYELNYGYKNSSYNTKDPNKEGSKEVLITNY